MWESEIEIESDRTQTDDDEIECEGESSSSTIARLHADKGLSACGTSSARKSRRRTSILACSRLRGWSWAAGQNGAEPPGSLPLALARKAFVIGFTAARLGELPTRRAQLSCR
jgi:hypothetical protein